MSTVTKLELLAPAKNLECGIAAVDHGADAVYIGASQFGARAAVGNSVDDIRQLCQYAHCYGVRIYVTVNTIIYDHELDATRNLLQDLQDAGVDAILVQDMGVLSLLPSLGEGQGVGFALHASTQTDNRTVEKVRWLRDLGFSRVVLARELSAQEIAAIHAAVPDVELEVFVHGALCVSYSGQCYASQYLCGRSANRGQCAQVCRMKFDLLDGNGQELIHQRHLLSLKDLNQSEHLAELIEAGATSFKIEGRLKDVAYVKNVVAAYSQRLDAYIAAHPGLYRRASYGHCCYTFTPDLKKTFNRGFTNYFLTCRRGADGELLGRQPGLFSPDTPKAMGEYVGTVKELRRDSFNVAGTASFANGDGLCFLNGQRELEGLRINRAEGNRLYPQQMPHNLRPGMALYRNHDMELERLLSRPSSDRRIPITMHLAVTSDGFSLSANGTTVTIACEHQHAEKPQHDNIVRQLSKLGGTPYECTGVELPADFGYFIPSSLLSDLRRQMVDALIHACYTDDGTCTPVTPHPHTSAPSYSRSYLYNISNRIAQQFYGAEDVTAYELKGGAGPLMQCRFCLRFELGWCTKQNRRPAGSAPSGEVKGGIPLFLRLADGHRFRLEFDCRHCQMNVYAAR